MDSAPLTIDEPLRASLQMLVESGHTPTPSETQQLSRQFGELRATLLLESASLQSKARLKFGEGWWWCTSKSLQQATAWQVARYKASVLNTWPVADLCCGIGGDTMALAQHGETVGVDSDPLMIALATANCPAAKLVQTDASQFASQWASSVHLDPDRRPQQRRTSAPEFSAPSWDQVQDIIARAPAALVKLAPAAELDVSEFSRPTQRCWISLRGSVREQTLCVGEAAKATGRAAIAIRGDATYQRFSLERDDSSLQPAPISRSLQAWIVDPDAAIRAAGLTDAFALANGLQTMGGPSGFLTTNRDVSDLEMAIAQPIRWCGSSDLRKLKQAMRAADVFADVVKLRGVAGQPQTWQRALRDCGEQPVTLWLGCVGKKIYAAF